MNDSVKLVQLWEGGPYWADRNIGADKPWDLGCYFWWGDTVGYEWKKDAWWKKRKWISNDGSNSDFSFDANNAPTYSKSISELLREGWITENGILVPEHDAAQKHWGGDWRMPTKQAIEDLKSRCDWTWTKKNGCPGCLIRGRGEYSLEVIFLPSGGGYGNGILLRNIGSCGGYWSSEVDYDDEDNVLAWSLDFLPHHNLLDYGHRQCGRLVRPFQWLT